MLDSSLFTSVAGAKINLDLMRFVANNVANINTVAFYGDYATLAKSAAQSGQKILGKTVPAFQDTYTDFSAGPIQFTGRDLDIAIDGPGFIAVQTKKGEEAFTRAGALQISPQGLLVTGKGDLVLGSGGVINIPQGAGVTINKKGEIYARIPGAPANVNPQVGKIRLVTLPTEQLYKTEDGLYRAVSGVNAQESGTVKLVPESLEGSNVDFIQSLVQLIDLSRNFDTHSKFMKKFDDNAAKANQLLSI